MFVGGNTPVSRGRILFFLRVGDDIEVQVVNSVGRRPA